MLLEDHNRTFFQRHHIIVLLLLSGGLWLTTCGLWDLQGPDEARYVQIAKELQGRWNWFLLTVHGEPYDQKPPLLFWLLALMLKVTGGEIISWFLRLPSVLASIGSVLIVYVIGKRCFSEKVGFFSALIFLSSPLVIDNAPQAKLDMLYTFWVALSLLPWVTRVPGENLSFGNSVLLWGALAGAFFTKGPLAVLIVLSAILCDAFRTRSFWGVLKQSRLLIGLPVLILLIYGWLQIQSLSVGEAFVKNQVEGETLDRLLRGAHSAPFWYYLARIFTSMFPWALFLIPLSRDFWKRRKDVPGAVWSLLGWFLPVFILLCVAHGKRQAYMLPLFPPLAVMIGWKLDLLFKSKTDLLPRTSKAIGVLLGICGVIILVASMLSIAMPSLMESRGFSVPVLSLLVGIIVASSIIAIAVICLKKARQGETLFYSMVGGLLLVFGTNLLLVHPAQDAEKSARLLPLFLSERCGPTLQTTGIAATEGADTPEFHVYGNYTVSRADVQILEKAGKLPKFLLVRENDAEKASFLSVKAKYRLDGSIMASDMLFLYKLLDGNAPSKVEKE